jgi:isocitrate lyase
MFDLADKYRDEGMSAYVELQQKEFAAESRGYTATKHQREVGAGYFDTVASIVTGGASSLGALSGSTEEEQFITAAVS